MIETITGIVIVIAAFAIYANATHERARVAAQRKLEARLAMLREADDTRDAYRALRALD